MRRQGSQYVQGDKEDREEAAAARQGWGAGVMQSIAAAVRQVGREMHFVSLCGMVQTF